MFLRPNDLIKHFALERQASAVSDAGRTGVSFVAAGSVWGVLASATPKEIERWSQEQHPTSHTIITDDPTAGKVKIGDRLTLGSRQFHVQGRDDVAALGLATIFYVEERNDRHG